VHLGRDAASEGAGGDIGGPDRPLRELLGDVLDDRQGVPDPELAVEQDRDPAGGGVRELALERVRSMERDLELLELDLELAQQQPRAQGPGRVVLVADDQLQGGDDGNLHGDALLFADVAGRAQFGGGQVRELAPG
jgi:hypothetical protein